MEAEEDPKTVWLTESPSARLERIVGETRIEKVEPEFRKFFTRQSLEDSNLVHRDYRQTKAVYRVPRKEVGEMEATTFIDRVGLSPNTNIEFEELEQREDKFAFIYKAKYRA